MHTYLLTFQKCPGDSKNKEKDYIFFLIILTFPHSCIPLPSSGATTDNALMSWVSVQLIWGLKKWGVWSGVCIKELVWSGVYINGNLVHVLFKCRVPFWVCINRGLVYKVLWSSSLFSGSPPPPTNPIPDSSFHFTFTFCLPSAVPD